MDKYFKLTERGTNVKTEIIAGLTTFMTMAYVLAVQPSAIVGFGPDPYITDINGVVISKQAILIMCALVSGLTTLVMGLYAGFPFALSCGMGTNFMLGALIQNGSLSFGSVMSIILISGTIFVILTVFGVRDMIVRMIPKNIKVAISTCIGFFVAYLGFKNSGIGVYNGGIGMGDFTEPAVALAILGFLIIAVLHAMHVKGDILLGILAVTVLGIPFGVTVLPEHFFEVPKFDTVKNIVFNFDFGGLFKPEAIGSTLILIFVAFFGDFFSTLGTVLGVAGKAKMLDENGDLPGIEKPFLVDAVGTVAGAMTGNTTITTFVESTSGVEAGGRTGLTSVVTAVLFLLSMFLSPIFACIPNAATGPALIFVGFLMISGITAIDFSNFTEAFGPFVMIMFVAFCGSIAGAIAAGILAHVFIKVLTGKAKEIHPGMYIFSIPLILYFILN